MPTRENLRKRIPANFDPHGWVDSEISPFGRTALRQLHAMGYIEWRSRSLVGESFRTPELREDAEPLTTPEPQ